MIKGIGLNKIIKTFCLFSVVVTSILLVRLDKYVPNEKNSRTKTIGREQQQHRSRNLRNNHADSISNYENPHIFNQRQGQKHPQVTVSRGRSIINNTSIQNQTENNYTRYDIQENSHYSHNHQVHNQNKTLVIIIGNLRGGEHTWRTLYNNVLDVNSADLALMIGDLPEENRTSSLFSRAKYTWFFEEYDDWGDAIDLINGTLWRETILPQVNRKRGLFGGADNIKGSGAIIFMIRWFLASQIKELDLTSIYERFIITRSDHFYACAHDVSELERGKLWLPTGLAWGGYTDRHLVVDSDHVLDAIDIYPKLIEFHKDIRSWEPMNPETTIKFVWENVLGFRQMIKHFDRPMFTCAVGTDQTRWRQAHDPIPGIDGLFKKYDTEFDETVINCARRKNSSIPQYSRWRIKDGTLRPIIKENQFSVVNGAT